MVGIFKQYVLGTLFYRFISENFANYIEGGDDSVDYSAFNDDDPIIAAIKEDTIKAKGYFIYPSQLFKNVVATANTNPNLNTDLKKHFYRYRKLRYWLPFRTGYQRLVC